MIPRFGAQVSKRTFRLIVIVVLVAGGAGLAALALDRRLPKRLAVVEPKVLYRSGQPDTDQLEALQDELGIKTVLIVRKGDSRRVPEEVEYAESLGMKVVRIPIDSRVPISDDQVRAFFECVDEPANQPVLVHCSAGRHRTGYLCALYRIERQGWSVDRAMEEMLSFGFDRESQTVVEEQLRKYPRRGQEAPRDSRSSTDSPAPTQP
ncbi:MAG: tyrosine-protein phosphatase [Planctomycetia bacterium]|jgi:tyrosine-protein phosphatase SIW14|nr:tyrosine-protein phosphatase [Planctomycetia bacterium]MCC7315249.1 tyrosine-protein phosphatase [Planctomycetota bacterium]OQZ06049.1 MAG: hypothetical protein B6D36_06990 [Planctomycetes bacterium UTPLA1]